MYHWQSSNTMVDEIKYVGHCGTAVLFGLTKLDCFLLLKPLTYLKEKQQ